MANAAYGDSKPSQLINVKGQFQVGCADNPGWVERLSELLRCRRIAAGMKLLDDTKPLWESLQSIEGSDSDFLLMLAQWVDVGYRDAEFLRTMLDLLPQTARIELGVGAYLRLRMAEAFYALAVDDADAAIRILDIVLRLDSDLLNADLKTLAHLWKGRAHRKKADYEKALEHIDAARDLACTLPDSQALIAIIQIQQGWLLFQRGDSTGALQMLAEAQEVLQHTDHWIALGNIESARGRIIRRKGDYARALQHFNRAVALYENSHPNHPNLARAVTNLGFVKRLLALQLRRHIDGCAARRVANSSGVVPDGARLRQFHKQYQDLYRSAIAELERAKQIYTLHAHHSGLAGALLNAGYLHLDVGDLDLAAREASEAYAIAEKTNSVVLKARARILSGLIENAHVEELLGTPEDTPAYAGRAKEYCLEAISLAESTENVRLLLNAHLALGETAANNFFHDYDLAQRCVDTASALLAPDDADYVIDELNALKAKLLQTVGIQDTLRAWSEGIITGKTFQEVVEEFAQIVVPRVWLREERKISRVAKKLSMSPQKVRRLVKRSGFSSGESNPESSDLR